MLAYFAALGYILDESGGPQILADTEVLASGSLNGFIPGRHFNRCKRLQPLMAAAIPVLHLRSFTARHGPIPDSLMCYLKKLKKNPSVDALEKLECSQEFEEFMDEYDKFSDQT